MADGKEEDRLFVKDGFRHYRRKYSITEVRWGLACGAVMLLITAWVMWRSRNPLDPELFADGAELLKVAVVPGAVAAGGADRGPLPKDLAAAGWREDKVAQFDAENLYVKINGRADYFKGFGFKRLFNVVVLNEKDAQVTVDVEMYDMGATANALGAYSGERAPTIKPEVTDTGLHHFDRNALYLARGPYYIRVIGSDEGPVVTEKLRGLKETLVAGVKGEPLPWAYGLFVGQMGIDPSKIAYFPENAFSLSFARDMWTVRPLGKDSDLELFINAQPDAATAKKTAERLHKSFSELGTPGGKADKITLVKDQFLGLFSGVGPVDRFLIGVRGAANKEMAAEELGKLRDAVAKAPQDLKDRARPAVGEKAAEEGGSDVH